MVPASSSGITGIFAGRCALLRTEIRILLHYFPGADHAFISGKKKKTA